MKRNAVIHFEFPSKKQLEILLNALMPETKKPATSRSKVSIEGEGKKLIIRIEAKDTSALRATLNSYLRWAALVKDTYEAVASLEKAV
ncbi:MAG: KEOPS complex subunit Pcc1 [Candidatus Bathyarchaeota archaeon]|nr:KEOPS complex subunit Pcc1 [Candidatus Bathyarchaeota archaeon]